MPPVCPFLYIGPLSSLCQLLLYNTMMYSDKGKGLSPKYKFDPMRILEVHETSRKKGHGIGMWIVNNTITNTGGEIQKIEGINGFKMEFMIGDKI